MDAKHILKQYQDARVRVKQLCAQVERLEEKVAKMDERGYCVADVVATGRKGKKPLRTVKVSGFPHEKYESMKKTLNKRKSILKTEKEELTELIAAAEEYIASVQSVEIRSILSLYYVEGLNWVQVAHQMNDLYKGKKKTYTESSCRRKHDRYLEKHEEI